MNMLVNQIQEKTAELIKLCETHKQLRAVYGQLPIIVDSEINQLWTQAQERYVDACASAVMAALALSDEPIA